MHICFVAGAFPRGKEAVYTFVKGYVDAIADLGIKCSVIAPQSVTKVLVGHAKMRPGHWHYLTAKGSRVDVWQPRYISLSRHFAKSRMRRLIKAVQRGVRALDRPVDLFYAHFWEMGIVTAQIAGDTPVFVTCGEGVGGKLKQLGQLFEPSVIERSREKIAGVVYVSSRNVENAKTFGLQKDTPYIVAPNGYHPSKFYRKDQAAVREKLGFAQDAFIVAFTGSFIPRKGTLRLSEALKTLHAKYHGEEKIYSLFIGSGKEQPDCEHILFCGTLSNEEVSDYLNAADIFVLPTKDEGCCNAIVEALACGLPVVSSAKEFNDDILDENCSLRIDESSIQEIAGAIDKLYQDPALVERLSAGALEKAETLTIQERVGRIVAFLEETTGLKA
ncbi:MAG: glycosyltransferase family 4 protein [Butyrivibrio sp.]|nr:glycosyltransferase family 4 protein [Butyrivibrio sp.]